MEHTEVILAALFPLLVVSSVVVWLVCSLVRRTRRRREMEAAATVEYYHAKTAMQFLSAEPISKDREAIKLVCLLEAIAARIEIGIDRDFYAQCLAEAWAQSKPILERPTNPGFCCFAKGAFDNYRRTLDIWRNQIGPGATFIGGGFGIEGALEGMAVATAINAVVASPSDAKLRKIQGQMLGEWRNASEKIAVLRSAL